MSIQKVVRQTSGLVPPRIQVRAEPFKGQALAAVRIVEPANVGAAHGPAQRVKLPPPRIFPSAWQRQGIELP